MRDAGAWRTLRLQPGPHGRQGRSPGKLFPGHASPPVLIAQGHVSASPQQARALLEGGCLRPVRKLAGFPRQTGERSLQEAWADTSAPVPRRDPWARSGDGVVPERRCRWERQAASRVAGGWRRAPGCTTTASSLRWGCGRRRAGSGTGTVPGAGLWEDRLGRQGSGEQAAQVEQRSLWEVTE